MNGRCFDAKQRNTVKIMKANMRPSVGSNSLHSQDFSFEIEKFPNKLSQFNEKNLSTPEKSQNMS